MASDNDYTAKIKDEASLQKCIYFLNSIGIRVLCRQLPADSFLPGLAIKKGMIIINKSTLNYPGDILHEGGHIAVVPASERSNLNGDDIGKRENKDAEEMMAIAWSYAACIFLELDPHFVFHNNGYKGGGNNIADNFANKRYFGLPMLQWIGLAADDKHAQALDVAPYPHMLKWLRD